MNRSIPSLTTTVIATVTSMFALDTMAQVHPEKPTYKYEKCYGLAKAGKNDCFTATNSCAGTASVNNAPGAWIYLPQGSCNRIVGGSLKPYANLK